MRGALDQQHGAPSLRVTRIASHAGAAGAAAGVAEAARVVGLVGQFKGAAVDGHQQASIERLWKVLGVRQGRAATLDWTTSRNGAEPMRPRSPLIEDLLTSGQRQLS